MGLGQWMRVFDTVSGLVEMTGRFRRPPDEASGVPGAPGTLGQLETRLAGVVVAALKEAFDRDRARMDLERAHLDAERQRAEEALRAELRRQAADRVLGQLRTVAAMAFALLMISAALAVFVPGVRAPLPRTLIGAGWLLAIAALGCAFAGWQRVSTWTSGDRAAVAPTDLAAVPDFHHAVTSAAPWLLVASLTATLASLLTAL